MGIKINPPGIGRVGASVRIRNQRVSTSSPAPPRCGRTAGCYHVDQQLSYCQETLPPPFQLKCGMPGALEEGSKALFES